MVTPAAALAGFWIAVLATAALLGGFGIAAGAAAGAAIPLWFLANYTIDTAQTSCQTPSAVEWLDVAPTSGSVAAGASTVINVDVDASALAAGNHSAKICVHSNDPLNAVIEVPVSVEVQVDLDVIFENGFDAAP
jgi:hypothetical protein